MARNSHKNWSMDELRVLVAIYFNSDFSIGDDARLECQLIAACFEREPASVDRQWRNIAAIDKGKAGYNIGRLVTEAIQDYSQLPDGSRKVARKIAKRNGWRLEQLIVGKMQPVTPLERLGTGLSDTSGKPREKNYKKALKGFVAGEGETDGEPEAPPTTPKGGVETIGDIMGVSDDVGLKAPKGFVAGDLERFQGDRVAVIGRGLLLGRATRIEGKLLRLRGEGSEEEAVVLRLVSGEEVEIPREEIRKIRLVFE